MLTMIFTLAAATVVPAPDTSGPARATLNVAPACQTLTPRQAGDAGAVARTPVPAPHALGREPAADAIAAVLYSEGSCIKPVVIRQGIGAVVAPAAPPRQTVKP